MVTKKLNPLKNTESYREYMSRVMRDAIPTKYEPKKTKPLDYLNPLMLRINSLERKVDELEKKS